MRPDEPNPVRLDRTGVVDIPLAFDGAVLCGGASRRMGRDKALVPIDGVPMARRVHDALLGAGAVSVTAVGGDGPALGASGLVAVPDRWPGEGPLGGVVHALGVAGSSPTVAVLSCDLVAPSSAAIRAVVAACHTHDADVAVPVVDGRAQWTHAVWSRRVAAILADVFAAGERSIVGAAIGLRVHRFDGVAAAATADADRPEDLPDRAGPVGPPS